MAVPLRRRLPKRKLLYLTERTAMNVETPCAERQWSREPRGVSSLERQLVIIQRQLAQALARLTRRPSWRMRVRSVVPKTCSLLPVLRLLRACTHAYHALTRVLGLCAVACADAFARTDVLALHMPAACAMP